MVGGAVSLNAQCFAFQLFGGFEFRPADERMSRAVDKTGDDFVSRPALAAFDRGQVGDTTLGYYPRFDECVIVAADAESERDRSTRQRPRRHGWRQGQGRERSSRGDRDLQAGRQIQMTRDLTETRMS